MNYVCIYIYYTFKLYPHVNPQIHPKGLNYKTIKRTIKKKPTSVISLAPPGAHLHHVGQALHVRLRPRHLGPEAAPQTRQEGGHADGQLCNDEGNEESVEIMEMFFRNKPGIARDS